MGEPALVPSRSSRPDRDVPVPEWFDMWPLVSGIGSQLAGQANVIMQLSWPGVGYGVMNSRVHDGSAVRHPVKRARTTFTYLAVALLGTDAERTAYRQAVNKQHAQVFKHRDDEPVDYHAMDPRLQTWVAACLYYGTRDIVDKLHGPGFLTEPEADALYAHCARLGTTLQMPASAWPETREAFDEYWEASLAEVRIDPPVRRYLMGLTTFAGMWPPVRWLGRLNLFFTTGFLPPVFREAMELEWSGRDQARFDRVCRVAGRVDRVLPVPVRAFPFNALLVDVRRRAKRGKRLV